MKTYQGHSNKKFSLSGAFGAYGGGEDEETRAFAVSGSEDGGLVCWDVINKEVLQRIGGHDDCVLGVDIGDGGIMVSGGLDKTVRIWDIVAPGHVGGEVDKIDGDGQAMKEEPVSCPSIRLTTKKLMAVAGRLMMSWIGICLIELA